MIKCLLIGAGVAFLFMLLVLLLIAPIAIAGKCSQEERKHWMERE